MQISWIITFFLGLYSQQMAAELMPLCLFAIIAPLGVIWFLLAKKYGVRSFSFQVAGYAFFFLLGAFWATFSGHRALSYQLPETLEKQVVTVAGTVSSIPRVYDNRQLSFDLDVESIQSNKISLNGYSPRKIRVSWRKNQQEADEPIIGQRWVLTLRIRSTHRNQNPDNFDSELRYIQTKVDAFGSVIHKKNPPVLLGKAGFSPMYLIGKIRNHLYNQIYKAPFMSDEVKGLVVALSIGEQTDVSDSLWTTFSATGTNHLISISGLHLSAISLLTASLFGWFWKQNPKRLHQLPVLYVIGFIGSLTAVLYAGIGGLGVPLQRSALMVITAYFLICSKRTWTGLSILAHAFLVVILFDPWAPLFPGFWLSFGGVLLIVLSAKWLSGGQFARNKWITAIRLQVVMSLAMIPMTLWFFQQVTFVSIFANLFAIPFVTLLALPVTLLATLTNLAPLYFLTNKLLIILIEVLSFFARLPFGIYHMPKPPLWTIILSLAALLFWLNYHKKWRWLAIFCCLPMFFWPPYQPETGHADIVVFDVGQGNAAIIHTRNHHLIVDTGPQFGGARSAAARIILPYLRQKGIDHIDGILITHKDKDHSGGLNALLDNLKVGWALSPKPLFRNQSDVQFIACRAPSQWIWDQVQFEILFPKTQDMKKYDSDNDTSCVLRVSNASGQVLFTGDIGIVPQRGAIQRDADDYFKADILIAPHHGSRSSHLQEFVEAVSPKHVIFSSGYLNYYRHPSHNVVREYKAGGSQVWRTDLQGAILIRLEQEKTDISAWREVGRHYWWH